MGQMYTNDLGFIEFIPMQHKIDASNTLIEFLQHVGIPYELHSDDAKEFTQGHMGQILRKAWIKPSQSEPYSPWQNRVEIAIKAIKKAVHQSMAWTQAPSYGVIAQFIIVG